MQDEEYKTESGPNSPILSEEAMDEELEFPEGGLGGWSALIGATLVQYVTFGYTGAFGVFQDFYVREYMTNYTASEIGWIGGVEVMLTYCMGVFTGRAFDRGYFYHLMISGSLFHVIALFMLSLSHKNSYYQIFLTQGLCQGLACGLTIIPCYGIVSHYFKNRRPMAIGIVNAGAALGSIVHPIMLNKFLFGSIGFRDGVLITAGVNTFLLIVANLLMRTRLPIKKVGSALPVLEFFREPTYVMLVIGTVLVFFGLFFPVFFIQLDAILHNVNENLAFYSVSVLNVASILGCIIPNFVAQHLGVLNMYIFSILATGVIIFSMVAVKDVVSTMVFSVFYGFFSGTAISLIPSSLAVLAKDEAELGARMGIAFFFCGIAGLVSSPISGALLTSEYNWTRAVLFSGFTMIGAALFCLYPRMYIARKRGVQVV